MFSPKFTITNKILQNIGIVEACKEMIINAPMIPAWEVEFAKEAQIRAVHYGTHLEGNDLSFTQAKKVIEGEQIVARARDIQEVINYRNVLKFIERFGDTEGKRIAKGILIFYKPENLKKIHTLTVGRILENEKCGQYRKSRVVIRDGNSGIVKFSPPPPIEVPFQLEDFFTWLNSPEGRKIHPVLRAGITHYELVRIHPFVDGNGRVSRAFTTLILFIEGYDIKKLFSLEEHFDKDALDYYQALQSVQDNHGDLTFWLEYFTKSLAIELTQVKERVKHLSIDSKLKDRLGRQIALNSRQIKIVEYLKDHNVLFMRDAKKLLAKYSEDTILRDLHDLIKKSIVAKEGRTKAASYMLRK